MPWVDPVVPGGKSSVLLDVKPWDDETDMAKLEQSVRAIHMDGLLWGACEAGGRMGGMGGWA